MRKGWFKIPGVQDGDRTVEEQMLALLPAVAECAGKAVLDIGCAEGLIGREFARAGAARVHGIEYLVSHLQVAHEQCAGLPMTFELGNMNHLPAKWMRDRPKQEWDIVIGCGIMHKLFFPGDGVRFAAWCSRDLVLLRSGRGAVGSIIYFKHNKGSFCDAHQLMKEAGFALEKVVAGPEKRDEDVEYWRRVAA